MIIGLARLSLVMPGVASGRDRRSAVRGVLERLRVKGQVLATELEAETGAQRTLVGVALFLSDLSAFPGQIEALVERVDGSGVAQVIDVEREHLVFEDLFGEARRSLAEKYGLEDELFASSPQGASAPTGPRHALRPGSLGFGSAGNEGEKE